MQTKLDFELLLKTSLDTNDVKVGQEIQVVDLDGALHCSLSGNDLGALPLEIASRLESSVQSTAIVRSIKRSTEDPGLISSLQIRISQQSAERSQPIVQAEPLAEDPAGFTLTTTELERLAYDESFKTTLKDARLQQMLLQVDQAANREQALKQALDTPHFREFADTMLSLLKPEQYSHITQAVPDPRS